MKTAVDPHAQAAVDALSTLCTRIKDVIAGFEVMDDRAEPDFRATVAAFLMLHRRHDAEISGLLVRMGHGDQGDGSAMGAVNKAVVGLRALFDKIDADTLRQIAEGEAHVIEAFDEVLQTALPQAEAVHVRQMKTELNDLMFATGARA